MRPGERLLLQQPTDRGDDGVPLLVPTAPGHLDGGLHTHLPTMHHAGREGNLTVVKSARKVGCTRQLFPD